MPANQESLPKPIADFWRELLGRNILLRYGMTETGAVFKVRTGDQNVPDGSVGNLFANPTDLRDRETGVGVSSCCMSVPRGVRERGTL